MKKLLLGVITFALIITSCNKYADDFQELKDSIAALDAKVAGVATLQTNLTAVTAQITALQTAVAGLPTTATVNALTTNLGTVLTKVTDINTLLNTVATQGQANAAAIAQVKQQLDAAAAAKVLADKAVTDKLATLATTADLNAVKTAISNMITSTDDKVLAAKNEVLTATGDISTKLAALQAAVDADNLATLAKINQVLSDLAANTSADATTAAVIDGLKLALAAAQKDITVILNNTSMYNGDVVVTTDTEVAFYMGKLGTLGIVNGNVTVNTASISAAKIADVNTILSKIQAIIGTTGATPNFVSITSVAADALKLPLLASVKGDYTVSGADVADDVLDNVGGNVTFDYNGDYTSASLKKVGGDLRLVNRASNGTANISFPSVVVAGFVGDVANVAATGAVTFSSTNTKSINLSGKVTNLTAANATDITLGATTYAGLVINAAKATKIDLSKCTSSTSTISITTNAVTTVDLSKLATSTGAVTVNMGAANNGSVDLSIFNSPVAVSLTGPKTVTLPEWVGGAASDLIAPQATTITLAKHVWDWTAVPDATDWAKVETLTLGNVNASVALNTYATLITASVTGKTQTHFANCAAGVTSTGNANLVSLTLGGVMNTVNVTLLPKLTTFVTSGQINTLTLDNAAIITGLTLGHKNFVGDLGYGATGSDLTITNNAKLTTLAPTAIDKMNTLTVTGNAKLASFDFSSYTNLKDDASSIRVIISGNNGTTQTTASYSPAMVVTGSTPYQEAVIKSNSILTLKAYFAKASAAGVTLGAGTNIDINLNAPAAPAAANTLSSQMSINTASVIVDATAAITKYAEMALVVAE